MAKSLKDILAGVKSSKIVPGSTGVDPGVDYMPKAPAEQDLVAKHKTEKHADRVGNGDDVYKGKTKEAKYQKQDTKVYEDTEVSDDEESESVTEASECMHTEAGEDCPVHGECACPEEKGKKLRFLLGGKKNVKEEVEQLDEIGDTEKGREAIKKAAHRAMIRKEKAHQHRQKSEKERDVAQKEYNKAVKSGETKKTSVKSKLYKDMETTQQEYNKAYKANVLAKKKQGIAARKVIKTNIDEVITAKTPVSDIIHDFVHSDNPKFAGKSKEERKRMALGAYYAKHPSKSNVKEDAAEPMLEGGKKKKIKE